MSKFYKGNNDIVFKTIFCKKNNRHLLKSLVKEALKLDDIEIIDVSIPELPKEIIKSKKRSVDLVIRSDGKIINIEINNYDDRTHNRRLFGYLANIYVNEIKEGEDYSSMSECIQINLSNSKASLVKDCDIYNMTGKKYHQQFVDNFTIYEFNITKLKETCYNEYKLLQILDCNLEELDSYKGDKDMEKLKDEIKRLNKDSQFVELMSEEEEERKYINTVKKIEYNKGIEQGESQKTRDIAKKLLSEKIDVKTISVVTGLSKEEVEKIANI